MNNEKLIDYSRKLANNYNNKLPFKVYFEDDDCGIDYFSYDEEDNYYHGHTINKEGKEYIIGRLDLPTIKRAIVDNNFWIRVELIDN